eukprot:m.151977 g.151977  ORF g.151977 m.151977 type:complete len:51 (+) comp17877_c0_seq4:2008-2160(+)
MLCGCACDQCAVPDARWCEGSFSQMISVDGYGSTERKCHSKPACRSVLKT